MEKDIEFFRSEYGKLQYAPGKIRLFHNEWEKLGYGDQTIVLKKLDPDFVCSQMNKIIRKYAEYRLEHEYAGFSEQDKIIFDWHYEYFIKNEKCWLYRLVPGRFLGISPSFFSMFPTVMNKLKTDYTIISVVLGNTRDFMAFWCDNPEHTNTVFRDLLTEGYRNC